MEEDPLAKLTESKIEPYEDTDYLSWGKYGKTGTDTCPLQDIPAAYFHWWWHETDRRDKKLVEYIWKNIGALKMENPDLLWTYRK